MSADSLIEDKPEARLLGIKKRITGGHEWLKVSFMVIMIGTVAFMAVYPLAMIAFGSIYSAAPGRPGYFTLDGFRQAFSDPSIAVALLNTFGLALVRSMITMALAIFFCWIIIRTDTPFSGGLEFMLWLNFFLPVLPMTMGWILLLDPRYGLINQAIVSLPFISSSPFNIYGYGGIIWAHIALATSVSVIMFAPAFRNMDASLEESARMSGSSNFGTLARVTFPLLTPAILAATMLGFVRAMESFEIELLLGMPAKIFVYATKVYDLLRWEPPQYPPAMALSMIFMVIIFLLVFIQRRIIANRQYTTVSGKGYRTTPIALGRWKYATLGFCLIYLGIFTLLPLSLLVIGTFMKISGMFSLADPYTLRHWQTVLTDPLLVRAFRNSMLMAGGAAIMGMFFYSIISYISIRTKLRGRGILSVMSWLPWAVPGILLGLGLLWVFLGTPFLVPLYGSLYILIIAMIIRDMPLGTRIMDGTMIQVGRELEESARLSGASWFQTFRTILVPLLSPSFVATAAIIFLTSMREISVVILLYSAEWRVLSILMLEHFLGRSPEAGMVVGLIIVIITVVVAAFIRAIGMKETVRG